MTLKKRESRPSQEGSVWTPPALRPDRRDSNAEPSAVPPKTHIGLSYGTRCGRCHEQKPENRTVNRKRIAVRFRIDVAAAAISAPVAIPAVTSKLVERKPDISSESGNWLRTFAGKVETARGRVIGRTVGRATHRDRVAERRCSNSRGGQV